MRTQSERWFEKFCDKRRIPLTRIEESTPRMPDYEIVLNGQQIVVEVKEILPNAKEKVSIDKMRRTGVGNATGGIPGKRVRGRISVATGQIKARTNGVLPSLLVLCDIRYGCGRVSSHVDLYSIRVAMEGLDQIVFAVPQEKTISPYAIGTKSGPRKKMTETHNKSISAIEMLYTPPSEPISLLIYQNRFVAIPIEPRILRGHVTQQYRLSVSPDAPSDWEAV